MVDLAKGIHASRHATAGPDPITPGSIGAAAAASLVVVPASLLTPSAGTTLATLTNLNGVQIYSFPRTVRILDSFNRADSATSLGTADTGQAWTAGSGTWGIVGNTAYNPGGVNGNRATLTAGVSNGDFSATIAALPSAAGPVSIVGRMVDASNFVYTEVTSTGAVRLTEVVAGVFTQRAAVAGAVTAGAKVTLRLNGATGSILVNGVQVLTYAGLTGPAGTLAGFRNVGDTEAAFRLDNFSVSDDQRVSGLVYLPSAWSKFDVSIYWTNLTAASAAGSALWQYEEAAVDFASGTAMPALAAFSSLAAVTPAPGAAQEANIAAGRNVPAGKLVAFGIRRVNASLSDTFNDTAGLLTVNFRKAA